MMEKAGFDARVSVPAHVLMREIEGEAVLLNTRSEVYFELDEVGTRMLFAVTAGGTVEDAVAPLLAEYDVEPERLRADLRGLVEQLLEKGLLEVTG